MIPLTQKQEKKYKKQKHICHISREEVNGMFIEDNSHCRVYDHCDSREISGILKIYI